MYSHANTHILVITVTYMVSTHTCQNIHILIYVHTQSQSLFSADNIKCDIVLIKIN